MFIFEDYIQGLNQCLNELVEQQNKIEKIIDLIFKSYKDGGKVLVFGNGGSASTASHCALGFEKQSAVEGKRRLKALSLSDNIALTTAWANDISYESIFLEQLRNQLEIADVIIGISASGNSLNVLNAIEFGKQYGVATIGFTGFGGGKLKTLVDICIVLSCTDYGQVEDTHLALTHMLSNALKERIANG